MMEDAAKLEIHSVAVLEAVHAPMLMHFAEVVELCGGNPKAMLRSAGLAPEASEQGLASYRQTADLLELAATSLGRPDFGMLLASRQCRDGIEGALGHVMRHARCFGEVLELAVRHSYAHSLASHTWLRGCPASGTVHFGHDIVLEGLPSTAQVMEQILLVGHLTAIRLTGGAVGARRILLRHRRLSPAHVYRRYFGCEVCFDEPVNATVYRVADLACPILSGDPSAFRAELAMVERRFSEKQLPLSRLVRAAILHMVSDGDCTGDRVARELGLHIRTLHRRLRREGASFRLIRDQVRRDVAGYYLRNTDLDIRTISERLGFSEQSALSRRARKWFSGSPSDLRAGRLAGGGRSGA